MAACGAAETVCPFIVGVAPAAFVTIGSIDREGDRGLSRVRTAARPLDHFRRIPNRKGSHADTLAAPQADIGDALTDMWRSVLLFVPKALAFIAILIVGYFVARLVLQARGHGAGPGRLRPGGRTRRRSAGPGGARYDASDILARLAYYAVLLFTLQLAFGVWGPNPISDLICAVVVLAAAGVRRDRHHRGGRRDRQRGPGPDHRRARRALVRPGDRHRGLRSSSSRSA